MLGIKRQQRKNDGESKNINRNNQKDGEKGRIPQQRKGRRPAALRRTGICDSAQRVAVRLARVPQKLR
jgi:hypothetical protein